MKRKAAFWAGATRPPFGENTRDAAALEGTVSQRVRTFCRPSFRSFNAGSNLSSSGVRPPVSIDIHSDLFPAEEGLAACLALENGRVLPRLHYQSERQAARWLALYERWSPFVSRPAFRSTFATAFEAVARDGRTRFDLVALGCGGAQKEAALLDRLQVAGWDGPVAVIDASVPLLTDAVLRLRERLPVEQVHALAASLPGVRGLHEWLDAKLSAKRPRLFTLFSVVPNFVPDEIVPSLAELLRPGDRLLCSVNLAPVERAAVERTILPQYDNEETRTWLLAFLEQSGVRGEDGELTFALRHHAGPPGHWRVEGRWRFFRRAGLEFRQRRFEFSPGDEIGMFLSCRHELTGFKSYLAAAALETAEYWTTPDGEEAVLLCRRFDGR